MISIEAYRACIGSFAFVTQRNLKSIMKTYVIGSDLSSHGLCRLLKPTPFIALFLFLTFAFPQSHNIANCKAGNFHLLNDVYALKNSFVEYPQKHSSPELFLSYLKSNCTLLLSGDIELNPGPSTPSSTSENDSSDTMVNILKFVQGSFNQCDVRFNISRGIQCSCMTLVSICMAKVRKPTIWKESDLDFILTHGDNLFKTTGINRMLYSDELPNIFFIENSHFVIEFPRTDDNFLSGGNECVQFIDIIFIKMISLVLSCF